MSHVMWDDKYLIGIEQFDDHHKHLVKLLNDTYDMYLPGRQAEGKVGHMLQSLAEYARYHFDMEENWMFDHGYPEMKEHISDHQEFIAKVAGFQKSLEQGTQGLPVDIISFLRVWLLAHISSIDSKCGAFFREMPAPLPSSLALGEDQTAKAESPEQSEDGIQQVGTV
jgi:hemerythrin